MVVWHVDNLMGSCKVDLELKRFFHYLAKIYGPKMAMHTGQKHNHLRVDPEFKDD
jgi:hypothetical protein